MTAALLAALADRDKDVRRVAARAIERRSSPQDLLIVTRQASSLAPHRLSELLRPALGLTIRHYRDLTLAEQAEVRSVMAWLTSVVLASRD